MEDRGSRSSILNPLSSTTPGLNVLNDLNLLERLERFEQRAQRDHRGVTVPRSMAAFR